MTPATVKRAFQYHLGENYSSDVLAQFIAETVNLGRPIDTDDLLTWLRSRAPRSTGWQKS